MATKKTTKKAVKKEKKVDLFELSIKVNDIEFKTKNETIKEALEAFIDSDKFPYGAKTSAVFNLEKGKNKATVTLPPIRVRRLFLQFPHKSTALEVFASTLERRLNS